MNIRELEHAGVKGMRWRKGRKTPLDLKTDLERKKANPDARIEKQKNLSLSGTKSKKYTMTEQTADQQAQRNSMNSKIKEAEQRAKEERQEAARKALLDSIAKAKQAEKTKRSKKTESKIETATTKTTTTTKKTSTSSVPRRIAYINKPK